MKFQINDIIQKVLVVFEEVFLVDVQEKRPLDPQLVPVLAQQVL